MVYTLEQGVIKTHNSRFAVIAFATAVLSVVAVAIISSVSALPVSGPGNVKVGVDATVWDSTMPNTGVEVPIGGSGQVNGEFTVAERNGIQVGLRAQNRFVGVYDAVPNNNGKVGIYQVPAGESAPNKTKWNFDWSVDLRDATGVYSNKTLKDYTLTLTSNLWNNVDVDINGIPTKPVLPTTELFQESTNPSFWNSNLDENAEGVYDFRLVLTPKTFNGPALATSIQVNVVDQD